MTQVKICGLTRGEDVDLACALGAAYVGFVFAASSPRRVSLEQARDLAAAARPGAARVGVFAQESYAQIEAAIEAASLQLVQLHRPVREQDLAAITVPLLAVVLVHGCLEQVPAPEMLARCRSLLFDTGSAQASGGTGDRFDWRLLAGKAFPVPVFLAGGLDADNVAVAIACVHPAAVDVASGVESAPGVKERSKMERFFEAVRRADERPA